MTSQILDEAVLAKLEFPAIRSRLASRCQFSAAAELAAVVAASTDPAAVDHVLAMTAEAVDLQTNFPDVAVGGARDVRELAGRAAKGSRLQPAELLLISDMLSAGRLLRRAFFRVLDAEVRFSRLGTFIGEIAELPGLEGGISRSISPRGDVLDGASDELGRIRRATRVAQGRLLDRLNAMINGGKYAAQVQDAIITTRDGRYVIPIKAESRSQVPGVVHDTSSSGQTLFLEPLEVVELNNAWREGQIAERREIERILDVLSDDVGKNADPLVATVGAVASFDLALAKARLAFDMKANRPRLWQGAARSKQGHPTKFVSLVRARHPLIDPATVVPVDVELGGDFRVLLITGPNTGGKTVTLKTVGLLTAMAQAGLFIPADDQSIVSVFETIYVDVGDEQSIAQSLSTFSSHMRNIISMLQRVDAKSLVLLDEMGAGTDPQEGSALARALISTLLERGPLMIATTHYSEVKAYAYATAGVENASVEFDVQTLAPTYRLTIGVPGRSNAIAIARRLGMPRVVLERASKLVDPLEIRADALLEDIRRRRDETEAAQVRVRETERRSEAIREEASQALAEAQAIRREAQESALSEAEAELGQARQLLRRFEREREAGAPWAEPATTPREEVELTAAALKRARQALNARRPATKQGAALRVGDRVMVVPLNQEGEVVSVDGKSAEVALGAIKLRQPLDLLKRLDRAPKETQKRTYVLPASASAFVSMEIDVRGNRAAELEPILERYLNDAFRSGLPMVRIIHGKGTGALRKVVGEYVATSPVVLRSEIAPQNEGGDGATVAYLKAD